MPVNKQHAEFHRLDMSSGCGIPLGSPPGVRQKILSGALDEANRIGSRTRLLRLEPGSLTTKPLVHDCREEVFLVAGDLRVGNDEEDKDGSFEGHAYAVRPPGVRRGPFKSERGRVLLETHHFEEGK